MMQASGKEVSHERVPIVASISVGVNCHYGYRWRNCASLAEHCLGSARHHAGRGRRTAADKDDGFIPEVSKRMVYTRRSDYSDCHRLLVVIRYVRYSIGVRN